MVGQERLINQINNFNINNFPKSSILNGEQGCGKHTLIKYIESHLNLTSIYLNEINKDIIDSIYLSPNPYIYVIDGDSLTIKQQNIILKTIEEPLKNSFLIILNENISNLLPTIIDRCYVFNFDFYDDIMLKQFIPPQYTEQLSLLNILRTPGKLINISNINFNDYNNFSIKMISKLREASLANALTISDKFNYKEDYNKFEIPLMIDLLLYNSYKDYIENNNKNSFFFYNITLNYKNKFSNKIFDKKQLMISYIIELWEKLKGV